MLKPALIDSEFIELIHRLKEIFPAQCRRDIRILPCRCHKATAIDAAAISDLEIDFGT